MLQNSRPERKVGELYKLPWGSWFTFWHSEEIFYGQYIRDDGMAAWCKTPNGEDFQVSLFAEVFLTPEPVMEVLEPYRNISVSNPDRKVNQPKG